MLIDAEQLESGAVIDAGVVIVGGGLAGIALARQLADAGGEIAILESGGETASARAQDLYAGTMTVGSNGDSAPLDDYLTASRVRYFGGSGNVWGGKCGPLDRLDFERRDWVPHSGWPVTRAELLPYYDRACKLLELPPLSAPAASASTGPLIDPGADRFTHRTRAYTRYKGGVPNGPYESYKSAAAGHPRIRVYLNANVTRIALGKDGRQVEALEVKTLSGRAHRASGGTYVLATGGIENVRLLLASNDKAHHGIGNHSDWLGRGFQGHSTISRDNETSIWAACDPSALSAYDITRADAPHAVLGLSDRTQTSNRRLNFTITLAGSSRSAAPAVGRVAARVGSITGASHQSIYFMTEHPPNRESRISLMPDRRDALGMPRVRLDMRHSENEFETLNGSTSLLARELGRRGIGRLQWPGSRDDWTRSMGALSRHHMGATRMSASPRDGVVDPHGCVHGVANLYVAGSSVFPTSGLANPTLTLLALGFRMGDRLIARMGRAA